MTVSRTLDDAIGEAAAARAAAGVVLDVDRVIAIERRDYTDEQAAELAAHWTQRLAAPTGVPDDRALRPGQALALQDASLVRPPKGIAAALPVGEGKTLVAMLVNEALAMGPGGRAKRPLVLVPPGLGDQWSRMCDEWSRFYRFDPPDALSYGKLSHPNATRLLDELAPDLFIFDEGHVLSNMTSARTMRVLRYFRARPQTRAVLMSGTLGGEAIEGFGHLLELALRNDAPVPLERGILQQWAACLDPVGEPNFDDWRSLWPVVRAFSRVDPGPFRSGSDRMKPDRRRFIARRAFSKRLRTTPGYVTVTGTSCGASLQLRSMRPAVPRVMQLALEELSQRWVLPDGSELVDALEHQRHAGTLSVGFYNRIDWQAVGGRGDPDVEEWIAARRQWAAVVRNALTYQAGPGFDSPALIARACTEGRAGRALLLAHERWLAVADRDPPPSVPTWLDGARDWLLGIVERWIDARSGGIIWFQSPVVGDALAGLPGVSVHGQGSEQPRSPRRGGVPFPACSVRVHGTGWDGAQYDWHESLVIEPMSSAIAWQQKLGRLHRPGQKHGTVRCDVLAATWRQRKAIETAIARAVFVEDTRDEPQKLCRAVWES